MGREQEKSGYCFTVFKPGTPKGVKTRGVFGMFFIVLFIVIEFFALILLYFLEGKDIKRGGDV